MVLVFNFCIFISHWLPPFKLHRNQNAELTNCNIPCLEKKENMNLKEIASDWIDAWNKKDIDRIMEHYSDDVIFFAPTVIKRWGIIDGRISGKEQLRKHFLKGFELAPDLNFEFIDLLTGVDGMTIIYKRETGAMVADVIQLDDNGKGKIVKAYYGEI